MRDERTECREEMALTDAAITGEGERRAFVRLNRRDSVEPLCHQFGGTVSKVVAGDRFRGIGGKVP